MPWVPHTTLLGTHTESANFSHVIQYYEEVVGPEGVDPISGLPTPGEISYVYYPIRIVANQTNPASVTITYDDTAKTGTIAGHYGPVFNDTVQYEKEDRSIVTINTMTTEPIGVGVWEKLASGDMWEMVAFYPDTTRYRQFTYTATAGDIVGGVQTVRSTLVYQIDLSDQNWTPGKLALQSAVANIRS